mmetsp:Transcript_113452/g.195957  ORF Transcript_113452/g.195957 Transcript_113452/m.195957 type:complete len:235 (+) Transcript_113452:3-707(+)
MFAIPPHPRRGFSPDARRNGFMRGGVAHVIQHLLLLPRDDPQLIHLSAAAVLIAREGRTSAASTGWSTEEMETLRAEVRRLETAWRTFLGASGPHDAERAVGAAALHLAFREMEGAVRIGAPLPSQEEMLVGVAKGLLGNNFNSAQEVKAHIDNLLSDEGRRPSAVAEDVLSHLAKGQACGGPLGSIGAGGSFGSVSRASALVSQMLGSSGSTGASKSAGFSGASGLVSQMLGS